MVQALRVGQVAKVCKVSAGTVVNWITRGHLRGYTLPSGHRRIRHDDLLAFMKQHNMVFTLGGPADVR